MKGLLGGAAALWLCWCVLCVEAAAQALPVSVQVQQSAWTVGEAEGALEVRISVRNQGLTPAENVVLTLPGAPEGASFDRAPTRAQGRLAWPIGTLTPGDSAGVVVRVPVAGPGEALGAAQARLVYGGQPVMLEGRAARVAGDGLPVEYLAATPDADGEDPPIVHQAALLGNDPARIFAFVQGEVAHQPYRGSLHGARGALYGRAGNAVDKTNLLVALLRASGVPAGYRLARLDDEALERVAAGFFRAAGAEDHAGAPLDIAALRGDPDALLSLMTPEARRALGADNIAQRLGISRRTDEELRGLLLEGEALEGALKERLREHAWAEAWLEGRWVALDPSLAGAALGEAAAPPEGELLQAVPEGLRHHVSLRFVWEQHQPVWGLGRPERQAPALERRYGAGDLVGRVVQGGVEVDSSAQPGLVFTSQTTPYTPTLRVRDLERPERVEEASGATFMEFSSTFGGPLTATYVTGVWLQVVLEGPGQAPGQGEVHEITLGDRLPLSARDGAPFSTQEDWSRPAVDSLDVTTLLISATHAPPRVTMGAQQGLKVQLEALEARVREAEQAPPQTPLSTEDAAKIQSTLRAVTEVMALLVDTHQGERGRLLAQAWRQRAWQEAPRVLMARHRAASRPGLSIDLVRERIEGVGAPGQLRKDRALLRTAWGMSATGIEGEVMSNFVEPGAQVISTESVLSEAAAQGLRLVYLEGEVGLLHLAQGQLALPQEARIRLRRALERGDAVFVPQGEVWLGGAPRVAWIEYARDGAALGRLEDGSGGSLIEYAILAHSSVCNIFGSYGTGSDADPCNTPVGRSVIGNLGAFTGRLWGVVSGALQAAFLCSAGSQQTCQKISGGGFQQAINMQLNLAFMNLIGWGSYGPGSCGLPLSVVNIGIQYADDVRGLSCPACSIGTILVEGWCVGITALTEANNTILRAATDPILYQRPQGLMSESPSASDALHTTAQVRALPAALPTGDVDGTLRVGHARLQGELSLSWAPGAEESFLARRAEAPGAALSPPEGAALEGVQVDWDGLDGTFLALGAAEAGLSGEGLVDLYSGALPGALAVMGSWARYGLTLEGAPLRAQVDTTARPSALAAGLLRADGALLEAGRYELSGPSLRLEGAYAGALGPAELRATLRRGSVTWSDAQGSLRFGGQAVGALEGFGLGRADGAVTARQGAPRDELTLALTNAHQVRLEAPAQVEGQGALMVPVAVSGSAAGEYRVQAAAPQGWRLRWEGEAVVAEAPPGAAQAEARLMVEVRGPQGLMASRAVALRALRPAQAALALRLEEDPRSATEVDGVRLPAWIVTATHDGPREGRYRLTAASSDPRLGVTLATQEELIIAPGQGRRVGLSLVAGATRGQWPPAQAPVTIRLRATGDAEAALDYAWEVPALPFALLTLSESAPALEPGQEVTLQARLRATGNAPAPAALTVQAPSGLEARLGPLPGALSPGQEVSVPLTLRAQAQDERALPVILPLTVQLAATPWEQARGLPPQQVTAQVTVALPGAGDLTRLFVRALEEGDAELAEALRLLLGARRAIGRPCDPARLEALALALERVSALLEARFGESPQAQALVDQAARLRQEGCAAAEDPALLVNEGIDALRRGPDLVAALSGPREVTYGAPVTLRAEVRNDGDDAAPSAEAQVLVGPPGALQALRREPIPALEPGQSHVFEVDAADPEALGDRVASLQVDVQRAVAEHNEANNRQDLLFRVRPGGAAPPENRPPAFGAQPPASALVGEDLDYDPMPADPDGDPVLIEAIARPFGLRVEGGHLVGRLSRPGRYAVSLAAVDRYGAAATQDFEIEITTLRNPDEPPRVITSPSRALVVGQRWSYAPRAEDPEGGALAWSLEAAPEGLTLEGEPAAPTLSWTPSPEQEGVHWIGLQVEDEGGNAALHRFPVRARAQAQGPDLRVDAVDLSGAVDDAQGARAGVVSVRISNPGDALAPESRVVVFEERDGERGLGERDLRLGQARIEALAPGAQVEALVEVAGEVAFPGNVAFALADALEEVAEDNEENNLGFSGEARPPEARSLVAWLPLEAELVLLAPQEAAYRVLDPETGLVAEEGVLEALQPRVVRRSLGEPGMEALLEHVAVEAEGRVQAYLTREIFAPDFGGDLFHADREGVKVGREFVVYAPTLTPNNRLVVVAAQEAQVELRDAQGALVDLTALSPGQPWEPRGLLQGEVYLLEADGDVVVQSSSVTGFSVVPPAERARARRGDVGEEFYFSVRSRGPGGGAVVVQGNAAASYTLTTWDGRELLRGEVARGAVAFHDNLGEQVGLRLRATAPVSVLAGDLARPGAGAIGLLGEDFSQQIGEEGRAFVVHSLSQVSGDSVVLAGPEGAALRINGQEERLGPYGVRALPDGAVYEISASSPVWVQLQGGGDRNFDMGDALRERPDPAQAPAASLSRVEIDAQTCTQGVRASARLGSRGNVALDPGARLELVELGANGERVLDSAPVGRALAPGAWADLDLEGRPAPGDDLRVWLVRAVQTGADPIWSAGVEGIGPGQRCEDLAPVFVSTPPLQATPGQPWAYAAEAVDPEGGPVRYLLLSGPAGATIDELTGLIAWTPADNTPSAPFLLGAQDLGGALGEQRFTVLAPAAPRAACEVDQDQDGACAGDDCDDQAPGVRPGALEILGDGIDNDCDPLTPDAIPRGAAALALSADAPSYVLGERTALVASVRNQGRLQALSGARVEVEVRCEGQPVAALQAAVPTLGPGATVGLPLVWLTEATGACEARAALLASSEPLAQALATFTVRSPLQGALVASPEAAPQGEPVALRWSLRNTQARPVTAQLTISHPALPQALLRAEVEIQGDAEAAGEGQVDTAALAPARYEVRLMDREAELARGVFFVLAPAALEAPALGEGEAAPQDAGAASSPLRVRPLGPRPGGAQDGGRLRAAWAPERLLLTVELRDNTEDPSDAVGLWLSREGALTTALTWERGAGAQVSQGDATVTATHSGTTTLQIEIPALGDGEALSEGMTLGLRVAARDGDPAQPRDLWLWSAGIGEDPDVTRYGSLTLLAPDPIVEPDAGMPDALEPDLEPDMEEPDMATADISPPDMPSPDLSEPDQGDDLGNQGQVDAADEPEMPVVAPRVAGGGCDCATIPAQTAPKGALWGLLALLAAVFFGRRWRVAAAALAISAAMTACDDDDRVITNVNVDDMDASDAAQGDVRDEEDVTTDSGAPDVDLGADVAPDADISPPDLVEEDAETPDLPPADMGDMADTEITPDLPPDEEVIEEPEGGIGEICADDASCQSGICLQGVDYAVCTARCDAYACPEGWICARQVGGAEVCVPEQICVDLDGDGFGAGRACRGDDCDDTLAMVHPEAEEACDGLDNDCDGEVDEGLRNACGGCGAAPAEICDGFDNDCDGDIDEGLLNACGSCGEPAVEVCNGLDDDCDGAVDEGLSCLQGCQEGASRPCYGGAPQTRGQGACRDGAQTCRAGIWGLCEGQALPSEEVCDDADNDCDGDVDEGTRNACGGCGPAPLEICDGADNDCDGIIDDGVETRCGGCTPCGEAQIFPSEAGIPDPALAPAPDGAVTLGSGQVERYFIWVPNSNENTVSRWDTRTGREQARYWIGENPSRTSVDLNGDVWIGNRGDGVATHIYTDRRDCVDRNRDGFIQTSQDLNGDGRITGGELINGALDPLADECVHCQVRMGGNGDLIRGVAIDRDNFAWFGTWNSREIYKVDPTTCEVVLQLSTAAPGRGALPVYGLAIDNEGTMWTASFNAGCVAKVDTARGEVVEHVCANGFTSYGIAVDGDGDVWWGDYDRGVWTYDREAGALTRITAPDNRLRESTGIVAGLDGSIYVAGYLSNTLSRYNPQDGQWTHLVTNQVPSGMSPCQNPRGVTFDADGFLWGICRGSSNLIKMTTGGEVMGVYPITQSGNPNNGTSPYSYSDNTGFQLFNYTVRSGAWTHAFDAGASVRFVRMTWSPFVPEGTAIEVQVRAAATREGLLEAEWSTPTTAVDVDLRPLTAPQARYLELRFALTADDPIQRPVLRDVQIFFETADCRVEGCPEGQLCNPSGGCVILPRDCTEDGACHADEYCDPTGFCRQGCRLSGGPSCPEGERCDPALRLCTDRARECSGDRQCASDRFCTLEGYCDPGCRLDPDSCPLGARCGEESRQCEATPPECAQDDQCEAAQFCSAQGRCSQGCREGGCAPEEVCDLTTRACAPRPADCDIEAATDEVCDGLDNDCDGEVDEEIMAEGESCPVGTEAMGARVCARGALLCRALASTDPEAPTPLTGQLQGVILPEGHYVLRADASFSGWLVVEPGAALRSDDPARLRTLASVRNSPTTRLEMRGAALSQVTLWLRDRVGSLTIDDTTIEGVWGGNGELVVESPLRLRGARVVNLQLNTYEAAPITMEHSQLEATDRRARWLMITRAPSIIDQSRFTGLNLVPRTQNGLWLHSAGTRSAITGSRFERLTQGLLVRAGGAEGGFVEESNFLNNDEGIRIIDASRFQVRDNSFDLSDPGHNGVGVSFIDLVQGGGAEVQGNLFRLAAGDAALRLDPDCFQVEGGSVFSDNLYEGEPAALQLGGQANSGEVSIGAIEGNGRFNLQGHLYLDRIPAQIEAGVRLGSAVPTADWRVITRQGAVLEATEVQWEDMGLSVEGNSEAHLVGADFRSTLEINRYLIYVAGRLEIAQSALSATFLTAGSRRLGRGIQIEGNGEVTARQVRVESLEFGIVAANTSRLSLTGSDLISCRVGLWVGHTAVAAPVEGCAFSDADPTLEFIAVQLNIDPGGRAQVISPTFDIGAEDFPFYLDGDVFQADSPTTITGASYVNQQQGRGISLYGTVQGRTATLAPLDDAQSPLYVRDHLYIESGAQVTLSPALVLGSLDNRSLIIRHANTRVTATAGATLRDLAVGVYESALLDLTGVRFESTDGRGRRYLDVTATATLDSCMMQGQDRAQSGVRVRDGGAVTVIDGLYEDLSEGLLIEQNGVLDIEGAALVNNTRALYLTRANATLRARACAITDTRDAEGIGLDLRYNGANMSLTAQDLAFDLGATDVPYRFELGGLRAGNAIQLSGSTFARDQQGVGYQLHADVRDLTITLAPLEPAHAAWQLFGDIDLYGATALTLQPGVALQRFGAAATLNARDSSQLLIDGAAFHNIRVIYRNSSGGQLLNSDFTCDRRGQFTMSGVGDTASATIEGCTFTRAADDATDIWGVHVFGASPITPAIRNNVFTNIRYGVAQDSATRPVLEGNTFVGCQQDVLVR